MIDELRRFILTSQEGNITKSAEKMFITQSALSQSIKRLESALQTRLLTHQGKHLKLTSDGQAIIVIGTKILQLWDGAKDPNIRQTSLPSFSLGLYDNAALRLGKYLQQTITKNEFHLELSINASGKLLSQLQWGVLDAAVCVVPKDESISKTVALLQTFTEELIPVSSKNFSSKSNIHPLILYNKGSNTRAQIDSIFLTKAFTPTIFAESTSTTFMKELAILGSGIALLPKNFVSTELAQGVLQKQKLPFKISRTYGLYLHTQSSLSKDHTVIKNICSVLRK